MSKVLQYQGKNVNNEMNDYNIPLYLPVEVSARCLSFSFSGPSPGGGRLTETIKHNFSYTPKQLYQHAIMKINAGISYQSVQVLTDVKDFEKYSITS